MHKQLQVTNEKEFDKHFNKFTINNNMQSNRATICMQIKDE